MEDNVPTKPMRSGRLTNGTVIATGQDIHWVLTWIIHSKRSRILKCNKFNLGFFSLNFLSQLIFFYFSFFVSLQTRCSNCEKIWNMCKTWKWWRWEWIYPNPHPPTVFFPFLSLTNPILNEKEKQKIRKI